MLKIIRAALGWDTPTAPSHDRSALARELGHVDDMHCLARMQGHCPGLEFCPDCPWSEDAEREEAGHRPRR